MIHLDTHVAAWIFVGDEEKLKPVAHRLFGANSFAISPMVMFELKLLGEIGRLNFEPHSLLGHLSDQLGLAVSQTDFSRVIDIAQGLSWTRDPFDRIIVAHAIADGATLLTRDAAILRNCSSAAWS